VPINDAAKSALEKMRSLAVKDNDFVFAAGKSHITDVKNPFATALKRAKAQLIEAEKKDSAAGLEGFRFHDLRHTAASWLAMGGAGLPAIQKFLGHASIKMTLRYAHLSPDFLGQEAKILDRMLAPAGFVSKNQELSQKAKRNQKGHGDARSAVLTTDVTA